MLWIFGPRWLHLLGYVRKMYNLLFREGNFKTLRYYIDYETKLTRSMHDGRNGFVYSIRGLSIDTTDWIKERRKNSVKYEKLQLERKLAKTKPRSNFWAWSLFTESEIRNNHKRYINSTLGMYPRKGLWQGMFETKSRALTDSMLDVRVLKYLPRQVPLSLHLVLQLLGNVWYQDIYQVTDSKNEMLWTNSRQVKFNLNTRSKGFHTSKTTTKASRTTSSFQ